MLAALASRSTVSQPVSTTGENAMTSTRWAMNERSALIWFSCFCCASENRSVMPASAAALCTEVVLAVRHSLSAPIWLKPSTMGLAASPAGGFRIAAGAGREQGGARRRTPVEWNDFIVFPIYSS